MPGVFISHSSKDKEFVFRLALDLLGAGFPVWLDAYEMELGSQLRRMIHEGIDGSTHVILVLSEASVGSDWVKEELDLALEKEKEIDHPFILPIKLGDCVVPLSIRSRLYANFTNDYHKPLEQLENVLHKRGADAVRLPFEQQLIPIRLDHSIFVDEILLNKRLSQLPFASRSRFKPAQFVLSPDPLYNQLRAKLLRTLQRVEQDPTEGQEGRNYVRAAYEDTKRGERVLENGLAALANFIAARGWSPGMIAESLTWFVRLCRNNALERMWAAQKSDEPDVLSLGPHIKKNLFHDRDETKEFYGVETIHEYAVFREDAGEVTSVTTGVDNFIDEYLEDFKGDLNFSMSLVDANSETLYKFILPQIFYYGYFSDGWSIEKTRIRRR